MAPITLDDATVAKLREFGAPVELSDASGRVIGKFVPLIDLSRWEPASPGISQEELERRSQSTERRYSTAEVLAHLEKL